MVNAQNWAIEVDKLLNASVEQANAAKAELKKKFEDMAKLEKVVAKLKIQNQQFTNEKDAAMDKLMKSEMLITELRD